MEQEYFLHSPSKMVGVKDILYQYLLKIKGCAVGCLSCSVRLYSSVYHMNQMAVSASICNETFSCVANNIEHYYEIPVIHQLYVNLSTKQTSSNSNPDLYCTAVAYQQIQLRTEDREWGSGGGSPLPPSQGFWRQL